MSFIMCDDSQEKKRPAIISFYSAWWYDTNAKPIKQNEGSLKWMGLSTYLIRAECRSDYYFLNKMYKYAKTRVPNTGPYGWKVLQIIWCEVSTYII